jgi:Tfp pilus assembly protein FimT
MELILVIIIISIILLIAVPNIDSFHSIKFNSAIKKVSSDIRYAQAFSIALHKVIGVEFNSSQNSYRLFDAQDNSTLKDPLTNANFEIDFDTYSQYQGIKINSVDIEGGNKLEFNTLGIPLKSDGNNLTQVASVTFTYRGKTSIVYIYPNTGWVSIQ